MKVLHITILFVTLMGCALASGKTFLEQAVEEGNLSYCLFACKNDTSNCDKILIQAFKSGTPKGFVVKFIKDAGLVNGHALVMLYNFGSEHVREKALEEISFSQDDMIAAASTISVVCSPTNFFDLFDRITTKEGQESVVRNGIQNLFPNAIKCIDPLIEALEDKSKRLKDLAIQTAFKNGVTHRIRALVKRFYDNPAITPDLYAAALDETATDEMDDPAFKWLLKRACNDDIQAFRHMESFMEKSIRLRSNINTRLLQDEFGSSRLHTQKATEIAKDVLEEVTEASSTKGIVDIVGSFMTGYEDERELVLGEDEEEEEDLLPPYVPQAQEVGEWESDEE